MAIAQSTTVQWWVSVDLNLIRFYEFGVNKLATITEKKINSFIPFLRFEGEGFGASCGSKVREEGRRRAGFPHHRASPRLD